MADTVTRQVIEIVMDEGAGFKFRSAGREVIVPSGTCIVVEETTAELIHELRVRPGNQGEFCLDEDHGPHFRFDRDPGTRLSPRMVRNMKFVRI